MSISCKMCRAEAPDDAVFCEECGQKLESPSADAVPTVACPACGTANPPDSAFCEECGAEIPDDAEKGGRKPGFLATAAKAGMGGAALGGAGAGIAAALGGGGGGAASTAGAEAAETAAEAAAETLGQAAGGASAGGAPSGAHVGTPHTGTPDAILQGGAGPQTGAPDAGASLGTSPGQPPVKPHLAHPPSGQPPASATGPAPGPAPTGTPTGITPSAPSMPPTATAPPAGSAPTPTSMSGTAPSAPPGAPAPPATSVPGTAPSTGAAGAETPSAGMPPGDTPASTSVRTVATRASRPVRRGIRGARHAGGAGAAGAGGTLASTIGLAGAIIKWSLIGLIAVVGIGLGASVVGAALIFTGNPSPCVDREVEPSTAASQALREQWKAFEQSAAGGQATITFDETGITSRGVEYIEEKDLPLRDLQVRFCPDGLGEASATIDSPGPDVHVLLRGTLDLSGEKPKIDVRTIKAGNLPGLFGSTEWIVNNVIKKSDADVLDIKPHLISLEIKDGSATLTRGP